MGAFLNPFRFGAAMAGSLAALFPSTRVFEWDAQDGAMWQDTAGTTAADDAGELVGRIDDLSGNGRNGTQATSGNRPAVVVNSGKRMFRFDGTSDVLSVTLPAVTGGTMVVAGQNGIWIESGVTNTSGAKSVGGTAWAIPGSAIANILRAVGDVIAVAYLTDTSLTAGQIANIRAIYMAKGSAGLFDYGAEIVTNGDGSSTTGWTGVSATASINAGQLRATSTAAGSANTGLQQAFTPVANAFYVLSGQTTRLSGHTQSYIAAWSASGLSGSIVQTALNSGTGVPVTGATCFTRATTATCYVGLTMAVTSTIGAQADFDNVSLRQLIAA